ncbi:MAG: hypothetical protein JO279_17670 [Verrucomicrobia bacterium]|nr:hypothetical protein [Verrucomicrobiota bacterium]MBV8378826.1 hypothetical protein [Verrucomicrobiota bacterium]
MLWLGVTLFSSAGSDFLRALELRDECDQYYNGGQFFQAMSFFRLIAVFLLPSVSSVFAEQILEGYSVVRGKDYAFEIKAPRNWVLDNEAGKDQGINLVFYPTGTSWGTSKAVIYVRVRTKGGAIRTIPDQVNDTLRNLRERGSPKVSVKHVKTLTTQDASKAEIYYFAGDKFGNFEAAAYIQAKDSIHFITVSAQDQDSFRQAIPAFHAVVTSYENLVKPPPAESRAANES